jgi:hypothetical protein
MKALWLMLILAAGVTAAKAQNNVDQITKDYYGVKNALTAGKGSDAQANAKILFAALNNHPEAGLNADQQKTLDTYLDKLKFDSRHISESSDIEHQREHFTELSKNWYEVVKKIKTNTAIIYVQYCPMKKAFWLSDKAKIENPYYSDTMPDCGKVTATLPAGK